MASVPQPRARCIAGAAQRAVPHEAGSATEPQGGAFAAVTVGGSVVTWGDPDYGGDSSNVAIYANEDALIFSSDKTNISGMTAFLTAF